MMAASTPRISAAVMVTSAASCGLLADFEQRILLADGAILGHVASGLAHEPDGRAVDGLSLAGANEEGIRGGHEPLNVAFFTVARRRKARHTRGKTLGCEHAGMLSLFAGCEYCRSRIPPRLKDNRGRNLFHLSRSIKM